MKRALAERVKQEMGDPIVPPSAPPSSMGYNNNMGMVNGIGIGNATNGGGDNSNLSDHPSKIPRTNLTLSSSLLMTTTPVSASPRDLSQSSSVGVGVGGKDEMALGFVTSKKRPRSPPNASSSGNTAAYQSSSLLSSSCDNNDDDTAAASTPKSRGPGRPRKSASSTTATTTRQEHDSTDDDDADNSGFYLKLQNASLASELYSYRRRIYLLEREREYRRRECRMASRKIGELGGVWKGLECAIGKELESNELLNQVCVCVCVCNLCCN
jgi:hypothetical protein